MPGLMTLNELARAVDIGEIDTVLVCLVDMQGRLQGKRFHAQHFIESGIHETHCCNYLLATDIEMVTVPGYKATSWEAGYGDYGIRPDQGTIRRIPWLPGTAMVMCDVLQGHAHQEVAHSPRAILKRQIARANAMGFQPYTATELEFFLFQKSFDEMFDGGYRELQTLGRYNIDYSIFGTTKDEHVMRAIRNGLYGAGIPVENSKGEAEAGQEEINIRYAEALLTADMHSIVKMAVKDIALQHGHSATFMAKYATDRAGSSSHIHQSLWGQGRNLFNDAAAEHAMSKVMRNFLAGQLAYARDITVFLAPNVNSYKRFVAGTFAPTKAVWSLDNRTAGFRVCGEGTRAVRVECRIGGADLNPYLATAALLAAGLEGIEKEMELEPPLTGDVYRANEARSIPRTLGEAAETLRTSAMLRAAFGAEVVEHYHRAALWEVEQQNRVVTDWEVRRGFERA